MNGYMMFSCIRSVHFNVLTVHSIFMLYSWSSFLFSSYIFGNAGFYYLFSFFHERLLQKEFFQRSEQKDKEMLQTPEYKTKTSQILRTNKDGMKPINRQTKELAWTCQNMGKGLKDYIGE